MKEERITEQIADVDVNLVIVSMCFLLLLIPLLIFVVPAMSTLDTAYVSTGLYHTSMCDRGNYCDIIGTGLNYAWHLAFILLSWFILNFAQLICILLDKLQGSDVNENSH